MFVCDVFVLLQSVKRPT